MVYLSPKKGGAKKIQDHKTLLKRVLFGKVNFYFL